MADNTTELEVLDEIVEVLGGQSGQYETVVPVLQQIYTLLGGSAGGKVTVELYTDLTTWTNGYIDSIGHLVRAASMITPMESPAKLSAGSTLTVNCGTLVCGKGLYTYDESTGTYRRTTNTNETSTFTISATDADVYYSLGFRTDPQVTLSPSAFDGSISETIDLISQIESNTERIETLEAIDRAYTNVLNGKKLVACGDSITAAVNPGGGNFDSYARLAAQRNNMTFGLNAVSGSTMTNVAGRDPFCVNRYLEVTDFDYLTIFFGWNDNAYASVGTMSDTVDTTFYGAYKKVLEHFLTTYPTKKIGLVVPYGPSPSIEPFQQAVRDLSEAYGVPCLDLPDYNQCSLLYGTENSSQLARRSALTYDGTHPNQDGHYFLSTMYERFLLSL